MTAEQDEKWRASVSDVVAAPIEKVWEILSDFDGIQRRHPKTFMSCETVEGEKDKVGSVRHLRAPLPTGLVIEANERLLSLDHVNHTASYSMEENNLGWTDYTGYISARSIDKDSTAVEWSCDMNPTANQRKVEFIPQQMGLFGTLIGTVKETLCK